MRASCMNCAGSRLYKFIDLGLQPNGNNFVYSHETSNEPMFPLSMLVCEDCWQVQISNFPDQEFMFLNHPYVTGLNIPVVNHFQRLAPRIVGKLGLAANDLVVDIGCNDGSLLKCFASEGLRTLGVDPGERTGQLARERGVLVFRQFWTHETGKSLRQLGVRPELITATATFYHVPDLHDFLRGVTEVMGPESCFVVQGVNLRNLIEGNQFDHFYHEHSCIHSIAPLQRLFAAHGLRIQDIEMSSIHGGSFILYVRRLESAVATAVSVSEAVAADIAAGLNKRATYDAFATRIRRNMDDLVKLLHRLKSEGKIVYALGAPVKGSTLLNYCGIGPDLVPLATEVNPMKIGRVIPGIHIPVLDERTLAAPPDYYLVLAWNFCTYLREKYREYLANGGRFIIPVPDVQIVGPLD
jgi:2-polyprenyl-3-methyl-5-hydroxy-6-metoxy-1,4-benzoquinol methylase